jgi:hypothetical protein
MLRNGLAATAFLCAAAPAMASGGLSCEGEDSRAKIFVESGMGRSIPGSFLNFQGKIEFSDKSIADDLRTMDIKREDLAENWLDDKTLKLHIYRERTGDVPHGYVDLVINTWTKEEGTYDGSFVVTAFDMTNDTTGEGKTVSVQGKVSCFVE